MTIFINEHILKHLGLYHYNKPVISLIECYENKGRLYFQDCPLNAVSDSKVFGDGVKTSSEIVNRYNFIN